MLYFLRFASSIRVHRGWLPCRLHGYGVRDPWGTPVPEMGQSTAQRTQYADWYAFPGYGRNALGCAELLSQSKSWTPGCLVFRGIRGNQMVLLRHPGMSGRSVIQRIAGLQLCRRKMSHIFNVVRKQKNIIFFSHLESSEQMRTFMLGLLMTWRHREPRHR